MAISKIKSDSIDSIAAAKIPNLDAAKITTGSIADARVPASAVTQHVTATDTSKIENDIAILALHQAVNENKSAYSLGNSWIEQFEDSTYITLTNTVRDSTEYVSSVSTTGGNDSYTKTLMHFDESTFIDSSASPRTITAGANLTRSSTQSKFGGYSARKASGTAVGNIDIESLSGVTAFSIDCWVRFDNAATTNQAVWAGVPDGRIGCLFGYQALRIQYNISPGSAGGSWSLMQGSKTSWNNNQWYHLALNLGGGVYTSYVDGVVDSTLTAAATNSSTTGFYIGRWGDGSSFTSSLFYMDEFRISSGIARFPSAFTPATAAYGSTVANATGNIVSTTIAPQDGAAKTSMGLVLLYKNQAGTNALNTDIICRVSADNGSNYTACVLAAKGTFSTGILIAVAPAVAVTSGTQLKYKVEFANQASGSKEARVHGVAMTY